MKLVLILFSLFTMVSGCRQYQFGEIILYGNFYESDCSDPIENAGVYLIDADFSSLENPYEVVFLDSMKTDETGRFEFVYGHQEIENTVGLFLDSSKGRIVYIIPNRSTYRNIVICQNQ